MKPGGTHSELANSFGQVAAPEAPRSNATRPFSIRLSEQERRTLEAEAGSKPLGTYVKARLLNDAPRRRARDASGQNAAALGQILGRIAKLQLTSSLSDLSAAAKIGALAMTPELERELLILGQEVREIRRLLMRALGFSVEGRP